MILKDLLKDKKEVVIVLNENNRKLFLRQAREEDFKWNSKKEIQENDKCSFHILINNSGNIANISTICYVKSKKLHSLPAYQY